VRSVGFAGFLGSAIEAYDFVLYGLAAALVGTSSLRERGGGAHPDNAARKRAATGFAGTPPVCPSSTNTEKARSPW
jgi:hypothetical protein